MSDKKYTVIFIIVAILFVVYEVDQYQKNSEIQKVKEAELQVANLKYEAEKKARFKQGPYVVNEVKISENVIAKTIIYPADYEHGVLDADDKCLVYENLEMKQIKMSCTKQSLNFDE
jgi:hypothetical protein